jgi:hypothetical protein
LLKRLETLVTGGRFDGKREAVPSLHCTANPLDIPGNDALRTHFQQLTEKMLVPLNRYFQTLVPTLSPNPSDLSLAAGPTQSTQPGATGPSQGINTLKAFSLPSFLSHLKTRGPNPLSFRTRGLTSRARVEGDFYASFCKSPTFAGWLAARVDSMGLAVAQQSNSIYGGSTLAVPPSGVSPSSVRTRPACAKEVGLGIVIPVPAVADLSLEDASTTGTLSPTQWSSGVSEAGARASSDGSSMVHGDEARRQ